MTLEGILWSLKKILRQRKKVLQKAASKSKNGPKRGLSMWSCLHVNKLTFLTLNNLNLLKLYKVDLEYKRGTLATLLIASEHQKAQVENVRETRQ